MTFKQLISTGILACVTLAACGEPIMTPPPQITSIITELLQLQMTQEQRGREALAAKCGDSYTATVEIEEVPGPNLHPRWFGDDVVVTRIKILQGRNPLGCQAT